MFVTAATPAETMGRLSTTECSYLPTYLRHPGYYARIVARHRLQLQSVVLIQVVPTGQQWQTQRCVCSLNGAHCCRTCITWYESAPGLEK